MTEGQKSRSSVKLWHVTDGPFHISEVPEDPTIPLGYECFLIGLVEVNGEITHMNLWYQTMDEAYEIVKHFKSSPLPIELE